jgi:hypothetical protein
MLRRAGYPRFTSFHIAIMCVCVGVCSFSFWCILMLYSDSRGYTADDSVRRLVEAGISAEKYTLPDSRHCAYMDNNKMFVEVFTNWTMRHMSERTTR